MNQPLALVREKKDLRVLDAIYARRAVRHFTPQPVDKVIVDQLLDASIQAPSSMNQQPWEFFVIQNAGLLRCLCAEVKQPLIDDPSFDIFYGASTLITICSRKDSFASAGDCFLAAENLMLAALAFGLGTCPIRLARDVLQEPHFQRELNLPENTRIILPIAVGYPGAETERTPRNPARILSWKT